MKRKGHIFEQICDIENISKAIDNAARGKKNRRIVENISSHKEQAAQAVHDMLISKIYKPKQYREFAIKDGASQKERTIYCPAFYPDQIVHWAIMQVIQPILQRGMYEFCCGSIPNRGIHYGKRYIERWLKNDRKNTKYCLKLDIKKYYPHISKTVLKEKFRTKIKDANALWLIDTIIDSHEQGLPIGNYTSQWWANFYLESLDHYIKERLHIKYYMRYMDDMVLFGTNKKQLHRVRKIIAAYIEPMGLTLKENWQVFKVNSRPIDFLGFRFYRGRTTLRRRNALRIRRRVCKAGKKDKPTVKDARAIVSYLGWLKHSNSRKYYERYIKPYINTNKLKEIISNEDRKQCEARKSGG